MAMNWETIPFSGQISDQMFDAVGKWIKKTYECKILEKTVGEIEKDYKTKVFEHLSHQEEFDWEGLKDFIDAHLLGSISSVFLAPDRVVREALRKQVAIRAYSSAGAKTVASQRQVDVLLNKVLVQVRNFLCGDQEPVDRIPFHEMTDQICVRMDASEEKIKEMIQEQTEKLTEQYKDLQESLAYQNSFAKLVDDIQLPPEINSPFHYRDPKVGFYGREVEIAFLDEFLDREEPILFTAVTGPAGAGKSKFLYEYVKGMGGNVYWKCVFFQNKGLLEQMANRSEWAYPVNLLVVIDYAGDYADLIGEWLVSLRTGRRPQKMRIVLLEREGAERSREGNHALEKASANPIWYDRLLSVHARDDVKSMLYTGGADRMFLELPTLSDDAFKSIIADYGAARGRQISGKDQEEILAYCKKIERREGQGSRPRPLILLFVVDAWTQGKDYRRWNVQELLLRIIERYQEHWKTALCGGKEEVFSALQRLLLYATATGGWMIESKLPEYLQRDFVTVKKFCGTKNNLRQLFLDVNEKFGWDGVLSPLEPDLIGELFVLNYLDRSFESVEMVGAFQQIPKYIEFLSRCIEDYADAEGIAQLFDNGLERLINENLIYKFSMGYACLLSILILHQKKENALATSDYLRKLALEGQYGEDESIVQLYAKGLFILALDQEVEKAKTTVERLRGLAEDSRYRENEEIVLEYAKGLFYLAVVQEVEAGETTVERLRGLAEDSRYRENEEIVLEYAKGLTNLGFQYYLHHHFEKAEESFAKAHQMGEIDGSVNLCYMIRRGEAKNHSPEEVKEILPPLLEKKNSFAIMNLALYLAEYENDWKEADNLIATLHETEDVDKVIDWWLELEDLEGVLAMTWLERHGICPPYYHLRGQDTLRLLRRNYPSVPDWIVERRDA